MGFFLEKFVVRWSDIDANKHVGNSSYMNFCNHTRISFFNSIGFSMENLVKFNLAPVILKEEFIFYREIYANQTVYVSLELTATSKDSNIFVLTHKVYDEKGIHHATSTAKGVWIDMINRKRAVMPEELKQLLLNTADPEKIKIITIEDIKDNEKPVNVDASILKNYFKH